MVSSCKICGARTARNRQYCPHCRITHKGKRDNSLSIIAPYVIVGLPFAIFYFGYYKITSGNFFGGLLIILFGSLILYGMLSSERGRKLFNNRINLGRRGEETLKNLNNKGDKKGFKLTLIIIIFTLSLFIALDILSKSEDTNNNLEINNPLSSEKKILTPEESLINFCNSQFSTAGIFDLEKTTYQNDFSSASDWIRNNYENPALIQEQKEHNINYIIENQLPKQSYPIVITSGSKKDGQVTSQGFYYCNEEGII